MQEQSGLVFGPFRLDVRDERLWRGPDVLPVRHKTLVVLHALVAQAGQLLTKEALFADVWPGTAVSETVLTVAIRELRRVLGDQARHPQFIATVHGRGYRFIAPVTGEESSPARAPAAGTLPRLQAPAHGRAAGLVGREDALAQLHQWWAQACQGRRQVGIIAGEPGMSKTALVATFVDQVRAREACWVGHGQCVEAYGAGEPYLPLLEAVGRLCQGPEGTRRVAMLRQYAPSWLGQLPALLPPAEWEALQRTLGPAAPARMLRELTDALEAFMTTCPLVLVVEDLHWSDRATLAWLAYVARRPDPARLLILGTYRPVEAMVHNHPLRAVLTELRQHGQCGELALDSLSAAAVTAYLAQRFGDTRQVAALARVLQQRTRGNPLFLSAVVDELVRQQVVIEGPAGWDVRAGVETLTAIIPAHLRALIELQLAQCSPEDQTLLAAASVAGVEFATAAVAASLEGADEEIEARCAVLAHQGRFLQAHGQATWPDGTVTSCYGFRHALYHAVVSQQIPAGRQTRWHARMGTRLAQGFGEEAGDMAGALARHLLRGRLLPQAVPYLRQAGQQATQRGAYREAVACYEQALHALQQLPQSRSTGELAIDLRFDLRASLVPLGEYGRLLDCLHDAETLAESLNDRSRLGRVSAYLMNYFLAMGDYDRALASGQHALALATALEDVALQVKANQRLGRAYMAMGDFGRAIDVLKRNVASLEDERLWELFGEESPPSLQCRSWLVRCLAMRGEFAEGIARGSEGLRIAEAVDRPFGLIHICQSVGILYRWKGDLHQAIPLLERSLELCRAAHVPVLWPESTSNLGYAYARAGKIAEALPLLEQGVQAATAIGQVTPLAIILAHLSEGYLLAGRSEDASDLARRALALCRDNKQRSFQAGALRLLGEIAAQRDPPDAEGADRHYHEALALAEELGMRPLQAHCHLGLGMLYAETGQREQAHTELSAAIEMYHLMEMKFWFPQVEAALAQMER